MYETNNSLNDQLETQEASDSDTSTVKIDSKSP